MLLKKHTAIQLSLCGVIIVVSIIGSTLLVRRGQALTAKAPAGCSLEVQTNHCVSEHRDAPVQSQSAHSIDVDHNDDGRMAPRQKVKLPPGLLSDFVAQQTTHAVVFTSLGKVFAQPGIVRPAYYAFLFLYTLF